MARDDVFNALTPIVALGHTTNAAITGVTVTGATIDTQGETGGVFLVNIGGISAGTIALGLQAGDQADMSDAAAVTDPLLVQKSAPSVTAPGMHKVAYQGIKRYICLALTSDATTNATASAIYASEKQDQGALA